MEVTSSVLVDMALANPKSHSLTTPAVLGRSLSPLCRAFRKPSATSATRYSPCNVRATRLASASLPLSEGAVTKQAESSKTGEPCARADHWVQGILLAQMRTFWGFMSRWMMRCACR